MKPATAKAMEATAAEELGRATLQIVHDLKNQLNGLKLYATFLRKRLERDDKAIEERETLGKLIAGLDGAAREMTTLVRYARPLDLRCRPQVDFAALVLGLADNTNRDSGGLPRRPIAVHVEDTAMFGEFDEALVAEALAAITNEVTASAGKEPAAVSLHVHREGNEARCVWHGGKTVARYESISGSNGCGSIHTALAAKIIAAHGGRVQNDVDSITVWIPLMDQHAN